jgi:hypothetical protein
MNDRYPYVRFVVDAAQFIAGAVALIVFLGGTASACSHGGFGGLITFLITTVLAGMAYVAVMVKMEILHLLLDIEDATRQALAAAARPPTTPSSSSPAA